MKNFEDEFKILSVYDAKTEQEHLEKIERLKALLNIIKGTKETTPNISKLIALWNNVRKTENETYVERRKALITNIENAIKRVESEIREKFYTKVVFEYNDLAFESKCLLDTYRSDLEYFHFNVKSGGLINSLGKFIMLNSGQSFQFQNKYHLVLFRVNNTIHTEGGVTTKKSIEETDLIFLKKLDYETREMPEEEKNKYELMVICDEFVKEEQILKLNKMSNDNSRITELLKLEETELSKTNSTLEEHKTNFNHLSTVEGNDATKSAMSILTEQIKKTEEQIKTLENKIQRFKTLIGEDVSKLEKTNKSEYYISRTNIDNAKLKIKALEYFSTKKTQDVSSVNNQTDTSLPYKGGKKSRKRKTNKRRGIMNIMSSLNKIYTKRTPVFKTKKSRKTRRRQNKK
jgi:hypothetical protein